MFKSIQEIKNKLEFIKKGSIYPRRIVKCSKRKYQHLFRAGCNQWAMPTKSGYLIFCENNDGQYDGWLHILKMPAGDVELDCSPYHVGKKTTAWHGNHLRAERDFLSLFNELLAEMQAGIVESQAPIVIGGKS